MDGMRERIEIQIGGRRPFCRPVECSMYTISVEWRWSPTNKMHGDKEDLFEKNPIIGYMNEFLSLLLTVHNF